MTLFLKKGPEQDAHKNSAKQEERNDTEMFHSSQVTKNILNHKGLAVELNGGDGVGRYWQGFDVRSKPLQIGNHCNDFAVGRGVGN